MGKLSNMDDFKANQASIRLFFFKWKKLFNLQELTRRCGVDPQTLTNAITPCPRRKTIAGYNAFNEKLARNMREEFIKLRADLDKVISDIDDYLD